MIRSTFVLALAAALAACATSSPDVVHRYDTQTMSTVLDAVVLSVRPVAIDGSQSGAGAVAGGVIGGIAGSTAGHSGSPESAIVGVLAAVAGGVIGNAVERTATREDAQEIMVQLRSGERRAIVQAKGTEALVAGDAVIIVTTGNRVRVSRAPAVAAPVAAGKSS